MKKQFLVAGLVLALSFSLIGCGGGQNTAGSDQQQNTSGGKLKGEISVWSWDVALAHLQAESEKFTKDNPDVKFNFEEMGVDQVYKKMTTSLQSGIGLPDVVSLEGEQMAKFGEKFPGKFVDFTNELKADDYLPIKIAEATVNGKIIAYPWDAGPCGMFYRQDLFEQAGIKAEDIKTWDDYIAAGKQLKEKTQAAMMIMPLSRSDITYRMLMMELGGFYFDKDGKSCTNSPESVRAMEMVQRLYKEGIVLNDTSWDDKVAAIKGNKVACIPEAVWMAGSIKEAAPDQKGKWRVMTLPRFDKDIPAKSASNGGSALVVPTATKSHDAAVAFVKFAMTDIKGNEEGFTKYGLYPSHIPSLGSAVFQEGDAFFGGQKIYDLFAQIGKDAPVVNYTSNFAEVLELCKAAVSKVTLDNQEVSKVMSDLQNEMASKFGK